LFLIPAVVTHIRICTIPEAHRPDIYEKLGLNPIPLPKRRVAIGKIKCSDHLYLQMSTYIVKIH